MITISYTVVLLIRWITMFSQLVFVMIIVIFWHMIEISRQEYSFIMYFNRFNNKGK